MIGAPPEQIDATALSGPTKVDTRRRLGFIALCATAGIALVAMRNAGTPGVAFVPSVLRRQHSRRRFWP